MAIKKLGSRGNDILTGTNLDESLYGRVGNDTLQGLGGNDILFGGSGIDTAVFTGAFAEYVFSHANGFLGVTHARGSKADGIDKVYSDVEILKFADRTINLREPNHGPLAKNDVNGANLIKEKGGIANGAAGDATATGNVLTNDFDVDVALKGQTLKVAAPGTYVGTYGNLVIRANGVWTYTLNDADADTEALKAGQAAKDTFAYTVLDGAGGSAVGKLVLTITGANDAPVITSTLAAASGDITEGGAPQVFGQLTSSDVDAGAKATWSVSGTSAYGSIAIDATTGKWTFTLDHTPGGATDSLAQGDTRTETFLAKVTDNNGATATQTITVVVHGTNDAPVVVADTNSADEVREAGNRNNSQNNTLDDRQAAGNVLTNDTDLDMGDTLTVQGFAAGTLAGPITTGVGSTITGTYGTLTLGSDGAWTYLLDNTDVDTQGLRTGITGHDIFSYTVVDSQGATSTSQVDISIGGSNDWPVAVADVNGADAVTEAGAAGLGDQTATGNALTNDTDVDIGDTKRVIGIQAGSTIPTAAITTGVDTTITGTYGTITIGANGVWTYTLDNTDPDTQALVANQSVTDVFVYSMRDGNAQPFSNARITITIGGANDAPVINSDGGGDTASISINENTTLVTTVIASDPESGDTRTFSLSGLDAALFNIDSITGSLTFKTAPDFETKLDVGADNVYDVQVKVADAAGAFDTQDIAVSVQNVNEAPTANPDVVFISTGTTATYNFDPFIANDTDPDGDSLQLSEVIITANGFTFPQVSDTFTVTTPGATNLSNVMEYAVYDGVLFSNRSTVTLKTPGTATDETGNAINLSADSYTVSYIEGRGGNDTLTGGSGADYFLGGAGDDTLVGNGGNDSLDGGAGTNFLTGGAGNDTFYFTTAIDGVDTFDFISGEDRIALDDALFTGIANGADGMIDTQYLGVSSFGNGFQDTFAAIVRIIVEIHFTIGPGGGPTSLDLFYDSDGGDTTSGRVHVAHYAGTGSIGFSSGDIFVV